MSITANTFKHNKAQKALIKKEVTAILACIDDEMRHAHLIGKHSADISLPINFAITYMTNIEAQRRIYYEVIISLIERKFIPRLTLKKNSSTLFIRWITDAELRQIDTQNALIAKYSGQSDLT